jgi:ATP-dependent DNA helicase RecQ
MKQHNEIISNYEKSISLFNTKPAVLSNDNKVLFEKLRIVRKEIATATNKPAYIVCTDKVLREVARQKPSNTNSFLSIKGIGKHFIQNYSSLFLNEIELNASLV